MTVSSEPVVDRDGRLGLAETPVGPIDLLSAAERRALGLRLVLALLAASVLAASVALRLLWPERAAVADLLAGAAALLVAGPVLEAAWHSLRHPDLHGVTDLLVGLAFLGAWGAGDLTTAALLPLVMVVGHVLEERSLIGSNDAVEAIGRLLRSQARRVSPEGGEETVPADRLRMGERVIVAPGERVPGDGRVVDGRSSLNVSAITGEAVPQDVRAGDAVHGGSINLSGPLVLEVTATGEETTLGRIVSLMQEAEGAKPPISRLLERHVGSYLALVLAVAAGVWLSTGDVTAMLAVVVASCPCALVLAAPATAVAAIAAAGRHGILVKGPAFLEEMAAVDELIIDKTGTVTLGRLAVAEIRPAPGSQPGEVMAMAAALAAHSLHPVSRAVAARIEPDLRPPVSEITEHPGQGLSGVLGSDAVTLGSPAFLAERGVEDAAAPAHDGPVVGLARAGVLLGWVLLVDEARPGAREAVGRLHELGLTRALLLTGDGAAEARRVADLIGIDDVVADALPHDKLERVRAAVRAGRRPLVVGDGINDALALRAGAVGVAMGVRGSAIAAASADLVVMSEDLGSLVTALRLGRRCRSTIHTNVALGAGWTALVVAIAATGVMGAVGPLLAALLHNLGTVLVMANAGRLLNFGPQEPV